MPGDKSLTSVRDMPPRAWWLDKMWLVYQMTWNPNMLLTGTCLARIEASGPDIRYIVHMEKEEDANPILMYPTGLKDKNGTEIYGGDIKKDEHGDVCLVYWNETHAGFYGKWGDGSNMPLNHGVATGRCEVIGNIHQHPGLLVRDPLTQNPGGEGEKRG